MKNLKSYLPLLCVFLFACAADYIYPLPVLTPQKCVIDYHGDSLVNQSGTRLQQVLAEPRGDALLPLSCQVNNYGSDGQMARHALAGLNGASQPTGSSFGQKVQASTANVIVVAWGANEALNAVPTAQYKARVIDILRILKGRHVVIESPPLLTNPRGGAPKLAVEYRAMLRTLAAKDVANGVDVLTLTVVDASTRQDWWDGGGIHPSSAHYWERARYTATALLQLVY